MSFVGVFITKSSVDVSLVDEDMKNSTKNGLASGVEAGSMEGKQEWEVRQNNNGNGGGKREWQHLQTRTGINEIVGVDVYEITNAYQGT